MKLNQSISERDEDHLRRNTVESKTIEYNAISILLAIFAIITFLFPMGYSGLRWWHIMIMGLITLMFGVCRRTEGFSEKGMMLIKTARIFILSTFFILFFVYVFKFCPLDVIKAIKEDFVKNGKIDDWNSLCHTYFFLRQNLIYCWGLVICIHLISMNNLLVMQRRSFMLSLFAGLIATGIFIGYYVFYSNGQTMSFAFANAAFIVLAIGYRRLAILEKYEHI